MHCDIFEGVIPLSNLKINPGKVVGRAQDTHRPILITSHGRGIAVVQGVDDFERTAEELSLLKAVVHGLIDIREGNTVSLKEAKITLGIK